MGKSLLKPLPKWLRRAIKLQAVSYPEAEAFNHLHLLATKDESAVAPKWLHKACDRLYLLELPVSKLPMQ